MMSFIISKFQKHTRASPGIVSPLGSHLPPGQVNSDFGGESNVLPTRGTILNGIGRPSHPIPHSQRRVRGGRVTKFWPMMHKRKSARGFERKFSFWRKERDTSLFREAAAAQSSQLGVLDILSTTRSPEMPRTALGKVRNAVASWGSTEQLGPPGIRAET